MKRCVGGVHYGAIIELFTIEISTFIRIFNLHIETTHMHTYAFVGNHTTIWLDCDVYSSYGSIELGKKIRCFLSFSFHLARLFVRCLL